MQSRLDIRRAIRQKRALLSPQQQRHAATALTKIALNSAKLQFAKRIAFYLPIHGEINDQLLLIHAQRLKKHCYLPVLHPLRHNALWFAEYKNNKDLIRNRYNILEPNLKKCRLIPAWTLNMVFVPLVGFDKQGNRLGMGKGYYDRTFAFTKKSSAKKLSLIGLAYEFQRCQNIPTESWDVSLDAVITEKSTYRTLNQS